MEDVVAALAGQHAELDSMLAPLDEPRWQLESRCAGWTVADVVLHLAQTDDLAIASATGKFDAAVTEFVQRSGPAAASVDAAAELAVATERGGSGSEVHRRWRRSAATLTDVLSGCDPHARVQWVAGTLSVHTLAATRLAETWIHAGDVAFALGTECPPTDRLRHIARLAWRTLPYAFALAGREARGPIAFDLRGPAGERWLFTPGERARTTITGPASDLCAVAARRAAPDETSLHGTGPDADAVLALVRTYA